MFEKLVAKYQINYQQILDEHGNLVTENYPSFTQDQQLVISMYRLMLQTRLFDQKAVSLQRMGKLGTYPSTMGQEAICSAVGFAMQQEDVFCPYYRENAAQFHRGVLMEELLAFWGGSEIGSNFSQAKHDLPFCVPIASQTLHAAGVAFAMKIKQQARAAVTVIGEGGTSRGDFYESMNLAGVHKLPVLYVINNNQYAISTKADEQSAAKCFAQKAIAAGIDSIQVDGNDIFAVYNIAKQALARAYSGNGPFVIEALTYRMCDHTTADDASRYRTQQEIEHYKKLDPIDRLSKYMFQQGYWDENKQQQLELELKQQLQESVDKYLAMKRQPVTAIFDYMYEKLPNALIDQRQEAIEFDA